MPKSLFSTRAGKGTRVVLVHGFTQTSMSFAVVAERLARDHEVVSVDLPGHGASGDLELSFSETAEAIGATGGRGCYFGYSLGGRLCLRLALEHPELVDGLVLLGASPGTADPTERAERRLSDERLAASIERDGVEAFLSSWLAQPLFSSLPADAPGLTERRANTPFGLATSLRRLGTAEMDPEWDRLFRLEMPVLVLAGGRDEKFSRIGAEMAVAIGDNARFSSIEGTGHAAHLEDPATVCARVEAFLKGSGHGAR